MGELRKDYILDRWVVIATGRAHRPHTVATKEETLNTKCFFCPGNEETTPKEIGREEKDGRWTLRWFANKFPAVTPEGQCDIKTDNTFYTFSSSYGYHELLTETPDHKKQLWDLDDEKIADVFRIYNKRIEALMLNPHIKYVHVIKNHGSQAGCSIAHSHSQIFAINHLPALFRQELEAVKRYPSCPYCQVIQSEKDSHRRCFENDTFVAFTPYASRFPFEIWLMPKFHAKNLSSVESMSDLAQVMGRILRKLKELDAPYNYSLHYSPVDDYHFHIEIIPRLSTPGGFELGTDEYINIVSPEDAAAFYRGEHGR